MSVKPLWYSDWMEAILERGIEPQELEFEMPMQRFHENGRWRFGHQTKDRRVITNELQIQPHGHSQASNLGSELDPQTLYTAIRDNGRRRGDRIKCLRPDVGVQLEKDASAKAWGHFVAAQAYEFDKIDQIHIPIPVDGAWALAVVVPKAKKVGYFDTLPDKQARAKLWSSRILDLICDWTNGDYAEDWEITLIMGDLERPRDESAGIWVIAISAHIMAGERAPLLPDEESKSRYYRTLKNEMVGR